jgi:hypothetical protein
MSHHCAHGRQQTGCQKEARVDPLSQAEADGEASHGQGFGDYIDTESRVGGLEVGPHGVCEGRNVHYHRVMEGGMENAATPGLHLQTGPQPGDD